MTAAGVFATWQPRYAAHGIPTFPMEIIGDRKKPISKFYQRIGLPGSAQLATKYGDAEVLGFMLGRRLQFTDVDTRDERVLADTLAEHGNSPIITQTASKGGFHVWYRYTEAAWQHYNGHGYKPRRSIKPEPDRALDYLGAGVGVAPPSVGPKGQYRFIQGSLDDLDRLPPFAGVVPPPPQRIERIAEMATATPRASATGDGSVRRNETLLLTLMQLAPRYRDNFADLIAAAREIVADHFVVSPSNPFDDDEILDVAGKAWRYETTGRNRLGGKVETPSASQDALAAHPNGANAAKLIRKLRHTHGSRDARGEDFAASPAAMAKAGTIPGWGQQCYRSALATLTEVHELEIVHKGGRGKHDPRKYRFGKGAPMTMVAPARTGRPPIGERAMTAAERKARSRANGVTKVAPAMSRKGSSQCKKEIPPLPAAPPFQKEQTRKDSVEAVSGEGGEEGTGLAAPSEELKKETKGDISLTISTPVPTISTPASDPFTSLA